MRSHALSGVQRAEKKSKEQVLGDLGEEHPLMEGLQDQRGAHRGGENRNWGQGIGASLVLLQFALVGDQMTKQHQLWGWAGGWVPGFEPALPLTDR